jgi:zinc protease
MSPSKKESIDLPNNLKAQHFTYDNGMRVLIVEIHNRGPLCGYMRVVNAGSAMEDGICGKGVAHFIEHMSFRIDGGKYWQFEKEGHEDNAMTTEDATSFYDFGDSKHLESLIKIDGERFLTNEVPAAGIPIEKMAVLNEEERGKEAVGTLFRTAQSCSHIYSRYHYPTIGMRADIDNASAQDMKQFRQTYYKLNNATFVIVGDVHTPEVLSYFENTYGHIKAEPVLELNHPKEPLQIGKRTTALNMPAPCAMICLTWQSPPANTRESVIMSVISKLVSNGGGGRKVKLLEKGVIHNVGCYAPRNVDSYIWCLHGSFARPDKIQHGETELLDMVAQIGQYVTEEELTSAVNTLRSEWGKEPFVNVHSTLMALGEACALGNWKDISQRLKTLDNLEKTDIYAAVKNYLTLDKLTSVQVHPTPTAALSAPTHDQAKPDVKDVDLTEYLDRKSCTWEAAGHVQVKRGARFQMMATSGDEVVLQLSLPFPHKERWSANLCDAMFGQSCSYNGKTMDSDAIQSKCIEMGLNVSSSKGKRFFHIKFVFNQLESLEEAMNFAINGIYKNTHFTQVNFNSAKNGTISELNSLAKNDSYIVKENLIRSLFHNTSYDEPVQLKAHSQAQTKMNSVKSFYESHILKNDNFYCTLTCPKALSMTRTHDIGKVIQTACKTALNSTSNTQPRALKWVRKTKPNTTFSQVVLPGYGSTQVMMGQTTNVQQYTREGIALKMAVQALGGGMTGRLMWKLRGIDGQKNGVYGVYAQMEEQEQAPTFVVVQATFTPSLSSHGIGELMSEVRKWSEHGITKEELETSRKELMGQRVLAMDDFQEVSEGFHSHLLAGKNGYEEWNKYEETVKSIKYQEVVDVMNKIQPCEWTITATSPLKIPNSFEESDDEEDVRIITRKTEVPLGYM